MSFQPPKGTDDLLPPRSHGWRRALKLWDEMTERYGYPLVATPIFEATELFERGVGGTTEVVTKQMYTFTDKGGRSLTLRPEGTAGVVRAYLGSGATGAWKGAYSGPFFRYERPQKGRYRQFWQVGVEYLAVESPVADAEVIELGYRYLQAVGAREMELRLNSIGDPACRPAYVERLRSYLAEHRAVLSEDGQRLIETNPLRVLDSKVDRPKLDDPPIVTEHLCDDCRKHYETVKTLLDAVGVPYLEDPYLVRGLDYYTKTAFEYIGLGLDAAQNALGGGGRYDGLAETIGGPRTPGVGFALGMDRIVIAAGWEEEAASLDAYLVSERGPEEALAVASELRAAGVKLDFDGEGRSVKAQFRTARRLGVPVVLVLKEDGSIDAQTEGDRASLSVSEVPVWLEGRR
ncbi:MAG: histidine--tRNA ligase [Actinomycetes bacterium]|jgi:histidyl-tRNA synthetase|nr:MAG: histidine--tRNA ligase [Actinomycetota bacterium]